MRHYSLTILILSTFSLTMWPTVPATSQLLFPEISEKHEVLRGLNKVDLVFFAPRTIDIEELSSLSKNVLDKMALEFQVKNTLTTNIPVALNGDQNRGDPYLYIRMDTIRSRRLNDVYTPYIEMRLVDLVSIDGLEHPRPLTVWEPLVINLERSALPGTEIANEMHRQLLSHLDDFIEDWKEANAPN
jgi:hypothetical protein